MKRRSILGLAGAAILVPSPAVAMDGWRRAYLGSYTSAGGGGVGVGRYQPGSGRLVVDEWVADIPDPSWIAAAPDGQTLYATSELVPDGIVSALRPDGHLIGESRPTGQGPVHVAVHPGGRHLFTSLYTTGSVVVHPIQRGGGVVGPASDVEVHLPEAGQAQARTHQVVVDPSNRWILSADLGVDAVFVTRFDARRGRLGEAVRVRFAAGAGPRHLVFHPGGRYVYVACEQDSTVAVCSWRAGVLTPIRVLSTLLEPSPARNYPAGIVASRDGRFVYVSNRGHNSIAVFAVGRGGDLRLIATPSCGGNWPRHITIDPSGRWLYAANQLSNEIVWYALDSRTGLPASAPSGTLAATAVTHLLL